MTKPRTSTNAAMTIGATLRGLERCPHCGVAKPEMQFLWKSDCIVPPGDPYGFNWATFKCTSCVQVVLVSSHKGNQGTLSVERVFPTVATINADIPDRARNYLLQAVSSVHAPDGATMLAGSAVDAMLKEKGLVNGSVYTRIDEATTKGILTQDMAAWAHEVRLGSNRPRHADEGNPHVTSQEAEQAIEFARTLGQILFVLPKRVERGRAAVTAPGDKP